MQQATDEPIRIGTAGWSIPRQAAARFPAEGTHLARYAQVLNAAEIDTSFYRPHRRTTYERWAASVPEDFRFAVKLPKTVTHEARLGDCDAALDRFLDEVGGLGGRLGALLAQLPPSLAFEPDKAAGFFERLQARSATALVCEPRHASWFDGEADRLLAERRVARVAADPAPAPGAETPGGAPELVYYRLHGSPRVYYSDYEAEARAGIADRLAHAAGSRARIWCIFDNTAEFAATGNALDVADRLRALK